MGIICLKCNSYMLRLYEISDMKGVYKYICNVCRNTVGVEARNGILP